MQVVIWEHIIAAILAITSFSIKANPKAPDGNVVLEYALEDADAVLHVDLQSTVVDNYPVFLKLVDDKRVKQVPDLLNAMRQAIAKAEGGRAMAKAMVGIDVATDATSATGFAKFRDGKPNDFVVVVRGKFAADLPTKLGKLPGAKAEPMVDGQAVATLPNGSMIGLTRAGALIVGTPALVMARVRNDWKAPARAKNSEWVPIVTALKTKPFLLMASKPSAETVSSVTKSLGPSFGKDLLTEHELAVMSVSSTGLGWVFHARSSEFAKRIETASKGLIGVLRTAHHAPRSIAQFVVAALPSYAGSGGDLAALVASKDDLLKAVTELTGDGEFIATVNRKGNVVTVTTKGAKVSDVVPVALVAWLGAIGYITEHARKSAEEASTPPSPPSPPPRGGLGAPVKPTKP